jgi:hypothetical protein
MSRVEVLGTPFVLIGTVEETVGRLRALRECFGFSLLMVHEPDQDASHRRPRNRG